MGCVPSKKRVERQQYNQELKARTRATLDEAERLLNEFSHDLDDRHEKRKQDAVVAKVAADALVKSALTPEEKVLAAEASAAADEKVARVERIEKSFAENDFYSAMRRKRLGLEPKKT
ncbi:hypothetical protein JO84_gp139 [Aureococcus anophagefferens virus]|uniref:Uncharacterized protein n=1 Tax=Aureococcus anophagefferens virus TaxID=1474867 RepID=A0A076FGR0_9VIRU|nr:hypothetical protein JO84_gp139 [Aureococcus anophagefferens virus]AII17265.1 hypothetical protein AaV_341 [Aureococcus anophagefferens virus]UOG94251.1 hypothetical protein MKD35_216 [Aureococcus anophagefferens virus]